jgi:prephenate dehydrogenase
VLPSSLGVIGLGAIGGSVAWSAARAGIPRVVGYALDRKDLAAAARAGAVTEIAQDVDSVVRFSDLVVLATPPAETLKLLDVLAPGLLARGALCTDVTVVKQQTAERAASDGLAALFAGSHPLVEPAQRGFRGASATLFVRRVVYVTPLAGGDRAASEIADFWSRAVGADPVLLPPGRHDDVVAWTTHLPHLIAAALAGALARQGPGGQTYPASALTATTPALRDPDAWADVLLMNRAALGRSLDGFERGVADLKAALQREDREAVVRWLADATRWREGAAR